MAKSKTTSMKGAKKGVKKGAKKGAKKVVKKVVKKAPSKKAPSKKVAPAEGFASKSCRKSKEGYSFKGVLSCGFAIAAAGSSKEKAVLAAEAMLAIISAYKAHQRETENTRRRAYRKKVAAAKTS